MFSVEFLNSIRSHELGVYKPYLPIGARVLEIGGGTGVQAKQLAELGLKVTSIDLPNSTYADNRVFPIVEYDGRHLPFDPESFDIIFSSNVLEHVRDLGSLHKEFERVLSNNGYSIHAMPSVTWRLWTIGAHYIELIQRVSKIIVGLVPKEISVREIRRMMSQLIRMIGMILYLAVPPRHGEFGNCITELYTFSHFFWKKHFENNNYECLEIVPMRLFYTGHMILGDKLSLKSREGLSQFLGSSCILYKVKRNRG